MGVIGHRIIVDVHVLVFVFVVCGVVFERMGESRHVGSYGELGLSHQITSRFTEITLLPINFMLNLKKVQ